MLEVFAMEIDLSPTRSLIAVLTLAASAFAQQGPLPPLGPVAPTTAPTTQSAEQKEVVAALENYNKAVETGDVAKLSEFIGTSSANQKAAVAIMGRLTTVGRSMYAAVVEKFGEAQLKAEGVERASFPAGFPAMPVDVLDVRIDGDKASLINRMSAEAPPLSMKKANGAWKLDGDALLPPMTDKQLAQQTTVLDAAMGAMEQTAADVKAGHFRTGEESLVLMNHRVNKAVQAAQMKLAAAEEAAAASQPATTQPK